MLYRYYDSPLGELFLLRDPEALRSIVMQEGKKRIVPEPGWTADDSAFADVVQQLGAYFDGTLTAFELPLAPQGTPFQLAVWRALETIPYGQTWSYGELANAIGKPTASRAVGAANGANPLPIVIPCHRVIGANGSLTGFGGGLHNKQKLLALEGARPREEANTQRALF